MEPPFVQPSLPENRPSITTKLYPDNVAGVSIPVFKMNYDATKAWAEILKDLPLLNGWD